MTPPCPHRHADPRMCDQCRRDRLGPASTDPDIIAAWTTLRRGLETALRPHVQDAVREDLVRRIVAEHIAGPGWKPPLRMPSAVIRDARVQRALAAEELA